MLPSASYYMHLVFKRELKENPEEAYYEPSSLFKNRYIYFSAIVCDRYAKENQCEATLLLLWAPSLLPPTSQLPQ